MSAPPSNDHGTMPPPPVPAAAAAAAAAAASSDAMVDTPRGRPDPAPAASNAADQAAAAAAAAAADHAAATRVAEAAAAEERELADAIALSMQGADSDMQASSANGADATAASSSSAAAASSSAAAASSAQPAAAAAAAASSSSSSAASPLPAAPAVPTGPSYASTHPTAPLLDAQTLNALDALLFGPASNCNPTDVSRWRTQGFLFSANPRTRFGLTQTAGGPCGVLAPVQAWILLRLLFGGAAGAPGGDRAPSPAVVAMNDDIPLAPTQAQQDEALVWALTNVIQRCAPKGNQQGFSLVSGDERSLHLTRVGRIEEVTAFWTSHLPQLHSPLGVLPFVYSVLLTRGLAQLRSDMDDPSSYLVGNFGHSSQELVNLMMIGRAVTNVFDGEKVLGDAADPTAFRLKGVPAQNEIGFLTLLEALRYSTVGEYYKSPRFPIWVVGSSNHYTVMFSLDRRVGALTPKQMKQRAARSAFDEMDPENNGFIPVANLAALLAKLGVQVPQGMTQPEVQRRLDPDGLGVMLYERVLTVLEQWEKEKAHKAAAVVAPNSTFNCQACTYFNATVTAALCEMCGTPRPPPAPSAASLAAARKSEEEIQNFSLYHFNGIEIPNPADPLRPKSACECHRVNVSVVEGGLPPQIQGESIGEQQGLKEILLTRWPSCILEVDGVAKI